MHLGAMVDLGVPEAHITEQLQRLPMANEFELSFSRGEKMGIDGTRAAVRDVGVGPMQKPDYSLAAQSRKRHTSGASGPGYPRR